MGVGVKIKALIKGQGLTQRQFAETIDENLTQLNKVLNGERDPSYELLGKTLNYFNDVDLNWLMRDSYQTGDSIPKVSEDGASTNADILDIVLKMEDLLYDIKKKVTQ